MDAAADSAPHQVGSVAVVTYGRRDDVRGIESAKETQRLRVVLPRARNAATIAPPVLARVRTSIEMPLLVAQHTGHDIDVHNHLIEPLARHRDPAFGGGMYTCGQIVHDHAGVDGPANTLEFGQCFDDDGDGG